MRSSYWSSDVCSSDLEDVPPIVVDYFKGQVSEDVLFDEMMRLATKWNAWTWGIEAIAAQRVLITLFRVFLAAKFPNLVVEILPLMAGKGDPKIARIKARSEEHTSELQSLMRNSYAVFCLQKKI